MKIRDYLDYGMVKIGSNTERSPGNTRRLTVTQTSMNDNQLTQV